MSDHEHESEFAREISDVGDRLDARGGVRGILRHTVLLGVLLGFVLGVLTCVVFSPTHEQEREHKARSKSVAVCHTLGLREDSNIIDCTYQHGGWYPTTDGI